MKILPISLPSAHGILVLVIVITLVPSIGRADSKLDSLANLRPIHDIHEELLNRFTPVDQPDGDVGINHTGDHAFTGDCDDYYTAAFNQLYVYGYDPFAYIMAVKVTGKPHIVACAETSKGLRCLDHNRNRVSSVRDLNRWYRLIETRRVAEVTE